MKKIKDREKLVKLSKDWEKQGIVILVTCGKKKCNKQPLLYMCDDENRIGIAYPNCMKKRFWDIHENNR